MPTLKKPVPSYPEQQAVQDYEALLNEFKNEDK